MKKILVIFLLSIMPLFCFGAVRYILPSSDEVEISEEKKAEILSQEPKELSQLSDDIKSTIPQKDILELYCLETKARSGKFFSALYALESVFSSVSSDLEKIGIEAEIPDIHSYTSQAQSKLKAVCSAKSLGEAQAASSDLKEFGEKMRKELFNLKNNLARDLRAKGKELKKRAEREVKEKIDSWVQEEKAKAQEELNALAHQLAEQEKNKLIQEMGSKQFSSEALARAYVQSRIEQIKADITKKINKLAEEKKKKIEEEANKKAEELLGGDIDTFKNVAQRMENVEKQIEELMAQKNKEYEKYKIQAAQKRKELILMIIDKKIGEAMKKLEEKNKMIKEKGLPVPDLDNYISMLQKDKEDLINKIDEAISNNRFDSINLIVYEMQEKWKKRVDAINRDYLEKYSPKAICGSALSMIKSQRVEEKVTYGIQKMDQALSKNIVWAKRKCQSLPQDDPVCQRVEELEKELLEAKSKANDFLSRTRVIKEKCSRVNDSTKIEDIMDDLISFRDKGKIYQKEAAALKAKFDKEVKEIYKIIKENPSKYKL